MISKEKAIKGGDFMNILVGLTCAKCGHYWPPRTEKVQQCPRCRTIHWNDGTTISYTLFKRVCRNEKCQHEYIPRKKESTQCPKCKTRWDKR